MYAENKDFLDISTLYCLNSEELKQTNMLKLFWPLVGFDYLVKCEKSSFSSFRILDHP